MHGSDVGQYTERKIIIKLHSLKSTNIVAMTSNGRFLKCENHKLELEEKRLKVISRLKAFFVFCLLLLNECLLIRILGLI